MTSKTSTTTNHDEIREWVEQISWEDWFEKFEKNKLAFLYQTEKANGEPSTFFKVINR